MIISGFQPVIGLEVHAQLTTQSKLFCGCETTFGAAPNAQTCPVCLGLPGALPVPNEAAIRCAIKLGLALGDHPARTSIFARKNYFYPDLPKGYQITQFAHPVVAGGSLSIDLPDGTVKTIAITRAHLEEDAGQSSHDGWPQSKTKSYVNLNRAGTPLLEIVSEPEIHSAEEAQAYLIALRKLVRYIEICDGNMEEGSFRCDANVSIRPAGSTTLGTRTELKNLNSFNNVRRAIEHEIHRQITLVTQGEEVIQATLLWDVDSQSTRIMRTKEDAHDYRYFPDPDLPPLTVAEEWVAEVAREIPELPRARYLRFQETLQLSSDDALLLTSEKELADYFEEVLAHGANPKLAANWIKTELLREMKGLEQGIGKSPISAKQLAGLIALIQDKTISGKIAKDVFSEMVVSGKDPETIVQARGLRQITDRAALEAVVARLIADFPDQVAQYREGKSKVFGFFVGQAMRATKGKANPQLINDLLIHLLSQ